MSPRAWFFSMFFSLILWALIGMGIVALLGCGAAEQPADFILIERESEVVLEDANGDLLLRIDDLSDTVSFTTASYEDPTICRIETSGRLDDAARWTYERGYQYKQMNCEQYERAVSDSMAQLDPWESHVAVACWLMDPCSK